MRGVPRRSPLRTRLPEPARRDVQSHRQYAGHDPDSAGGLVPDVSSDDAEFDPRTGRQGRRDRLHREPARWEVSKSAVEVSAQNARDMMFGPLPSPLTVRTRSWKIAPLRLSTASRLGAVQSGSRLREKAHDLCVGDLVEIAVVEADRVERLRRLQADDLIDLAVQLLKGAGRRDRNRQNQQFRLLAPQRGKGRSYARSRGDPVIDDDDLTPFDGHAHPALQIDALPPLDLDQLLLGLLFDIPPAHPGETDDVV